MDQLLSIFDLNYIVTATLSVYTLIKVIDYYNGNKAVTTNTKRYLTIICNLVVGTLFYKAGWAEGKALLPSFLASIIAYDFLIKPILEVLKLGYNK